MTTPNELQQTQSICSDKNISSRRVKLYSSTCGHNRFYKPGGGRSGCCQQIEALVRGSWRSHISALPAFAPSWEGTEKPTLIAPMSSSFLDF